MNSTIEMILLRAGIALVALIPFGIVFARPQRPLGNSLLNETGLGYLSDLSGLVDIT